jgi:hypothetical protein
MGRLKSAQKEKSMAKPFYVEVTGVAVNKRGEPAEQIGPADFMDDDIMIPQAVRTILSGTAEMVTVQYRGDSNALVRTFKYHRINR